MVGDRIRITAQLIEAETDTQLWSKTYDRELTDIFAIQDEIATEILKQLKLRLLNDSAVVAEADRTRGRRNRRCAK